MAKRYVQLSPHQEAMGIEFVGIEGDGVVLQMPAAETAQSPAIAASLAEAAMQLAAIHVGPRPCRVQSLHLDIVALTELGATSSLRAWAYARAPREGIVFAEAYLVGGEVAIAGLADVQRRALFAASASYQMLYPRGPQ